jgi:hypothetical protein
VAHNIGHHHSKDIGFVEERRMDCYNIWNLAADSHSLVENNNNHLAWKRHMAAVGMADNFDWKILGHLAAH